MAKPFLHQKTEIYFKIMEVAPRTQERQESGLASGRDWNQGQGSAGLSPSLHLCLLLVSFHRLFLGEKSIRTSYPARYLVSTGPLLAVFQF